jgi:hypothetical protein
MRMKRMNNKQRMQVLTDAGAFAGLRIQFFLKNDDARQY